MHYVRDLDRERERAYLLNQLVAQTPAQQHAFIKRLRDRSMASELRRLLERDGEVSPVDRAPHALLARAFSIELPPAHTARTLGPYRLLEFLGEGGMATVWRARRCDDLPDRDVAVKCLKVGLDGGDGRARFLREQRLLAKLTHSNIARLYDAGISEDGVPYIAMELIAGEAIDIYCDRRRLNIGARMKLFCDVLGAVAAAHRNLIVHRDIKPANILVGADSVAKLVDFGVAKPLDELLESARTLAPAFTPQYAAPEQFDGGEVTTAIDVYALGATLHQLLCGVPPRRSSTTFACAADGCPLPSSVTRDRSNQHAASDRGFSDSRQHARALRGDLDLLLQRALQPEASRRYESVGALHRDVSNWLDDRPLASRRSDLAYRTAKFVRRHWLVVFLASAALFTIGLAVVLAIEQAHIAMAERDATALRSKQLGALNRLLTGLFREGIRGDERLTASEFLARGAYWLDAHAPAEFAERLLAVTALAQLEVERGNFNAAAHLLQPYTQYEPDAYPAEIGAEALCLLAHVETIHGRPARALRLAERGALLAQPLQGSSRASHVRCLGQQAVALAELGRVAPATFTIAQAFDELQREADNTSVMSLRTELERVQSSLLFADGRFAEAAAHSLATLELLHDAGLGDSVDASIVRGGYAFELFLSGDVARADQEFSAVRTLAERNNYRSAELAQIFVNAAKLKLKIGAANAASDLLDIAQALTAGTLLPDNLFQVQIEMQRSRLARLHEDYPQANRHLDNAEHLFGSLDRAPGPWVATLLRSRAEIALAEHTWDEADRLLNAADQSEDSAGRGRQFRLKTSALKIELALARGDTARALELCAQAQQAATASFSTSHYTRADLDALCARAMLLGGDPEIGYQRLTQATQALISSLGERGPEALRARAWLAAAAELRGGAADAGK